ncbi:MAG: hypothetical protein ACRCUS_03850 [Anaerovoracaceae bacterium]
MLSLFVVILVINVTISLTGCGSSMSTDESFIKDLSKGIESRWDLVEQN